MEQQEEIDAFKFAFEKINSWITDYRNNTGLNSDESFIVAHLGQTLKVKQLEYLDKIFKGGTKEQK